MTGKFFHGETVEYRTSGGGWLPGLWVAIDPANERMGVVRNTSERGSNVVTVDLDDIRRPEDPLVALLLRENPWGCFVRQPCHACTRRAIELAEAVRAEVAA